MTDHPPGIAGYLVSAPTMRSYRRTFFTFPVDWEPPWWRDRHRMDYRVTPLSDADYHRPLVDIVKAHEDKLRDAQPA